MGDKALAGRKILIRSLCTIPIWIIGFKLAFMGGGSGGFVGSAVTVIMGMMFLVAGGLILAPGIAEFLGIWVRWIYFPSKTRSRPSPAYSRVEAELSAENYDEALKLLEDITLEHPGDPEPWIRMVEIQFTRCEDPHEAELVYRKGIAELTGRKEREKLSAMYKEMAVWDTEKQKILAREGAAPPITVDETPDEVDQAFYRSQKSDEDSDDLIELDEDPEKHIEKGTS